MKLLLLSFFFFTVLDVLRSRRTVWMWRGSRRNPESLIGHKIDRRKRKPVRNYLKFKTGNLRFTNCSNIQTGYWNNSDDFFYIFLFLFLFYLDQYYLSIFFPIPRWISIIKIRFFFFLFRAIVRLQSN